MTSCNKGSAQSGKKQMATPNHTDMLLLFFFFSVAFIQDIIIDCMVGAPGHGKGVVDGLNAVDKTYLRSYMSKISQPGVETPKKKMDAHDSTENGSTSFADICVQLLGLSSRKEISEGTSKRGKRKNTKV